MTAMRVLPFEGGLALAVAVAATAIAVVAAFLWKKLTDVKPFLNKQRKQITLIDKSDISHDTHRLVFSLDFPNQPLGLPVGQHLKVFAPNKSGVEPGKWNGKIDTESLLDEISRKYTPVSSARAKGQVELVIKVYRPSITPAFADGGKMSQFLGDLKIGDKVDVEGPFGRITYRGRGSFSIGPRLVTKRQIGLLAGGTGITPVFQLIRRVFEDHADPVKLSLIYANKTESDILLRDELEELENEYSDRISIWYTLDLPPPSWRFSSGFITKDMIEKHLPPPGPETLVLCCGPPPMVENACIKNLLALGHDKQDIGCF